MVLELQTYEVIMFEGTLCFPNCSLRKNKKCKIFFIGFFLVAVITYTTLDYTIKSGRFADILTKVVFKKMIIIVRFSSTIYKTFNSASNSLIIASVAINSIIY